MLLPLILCWDNPHRWMSMSVDKGQPLWIQLWHRCLSREKTKMTYNSAEVFYLCRVVYQPQYYRIPFWYSACPQLSPPQIFRKMDNRYFSHRPKDTLELPFHWKNDAGRPRLRAANGCLKEGTQNTFYSLTKTTVQWGLGRNFSFIVGSKYWEFEVAQVATCRRRHNILLILKGPKGWYTFKGHTLGRISYYA